MHDEETETLEMEQNLKNYGCDYFQGILLTEPFYINPICELHSYFRSFVKP